VLPASQNSSLYTHKNIIARNVASSNLNTTPLPFPTSFRYTTAFDTVHLAHTTQTEPSLEVLLTTVCGHHVQALKVMAVCVLCSVHVHWTWRNPEQRKWRHDARQFENFLLRITDVHLSVRGVSRLGPLRAPVTIKMQENFHWSRFNASVKIDNNGGQFKWGLRCNILTHSSDCFMKFLAGNFPYRPNNVT
jgi:hypothetical protein